ncbi:MAG: hypothetical protein K2J20_06750 [Bacilli bacterium]|nr:hypothetical protein [Bacilli bacterium]
MERLIIGDVGVKLDEGVDKNKFLTNPPISLNSGNIYELFNEYGYNLNTVPGLFIKIFTANLKEISEIKKALIEIDKMGLKEVFEANLKLACFKMSFIERLKKCLKQGVPYLNSDNTFISSLFSDEDLEAYLQSDFQSELQPDLQDDPISLIEETYMEPAAPQVASTTNTTNSDNSDDNIDDSDKQMYNDISKSLNYLILAHPTDGGLVAIIQEVLSKLADAILRKEYQFLGISGMISNILEEIGVEPETREATTILSAIPEVERGRAA